MKKIKTDKVTSHERAIKKGWLEGLSRRRFILLAVFLILGLTVAVYANSFHNEFTNWDDNSLIVNNTAIRSLSMDNIKKIITPHRGSTFQPMRVLSYAVDYHFWKLNPVGYHIQGILLHGLAAVFLYLALIHALPQLQGRGQRAERRGQSAEGKAQSAERKGQRDKSYAPHNSNTPALQHSIRAIALITALLFVVHPVNVESVTWLSGRKYTLLVFFSFLSFYLFVKSSEDGRYHPVYALFSLITCILSVMSSPFGVTLPVLFFLFDYCRDESNNPFKVLKKRFVYYIPYLFFLLITVPFLWYALVAGSSGGADYPHLMGKPIYTLWTMLRVLFDYTRNLIFPFWLNSRYVDRASLFWLEGKVIISICVLLLLGLVIFIQGRGGKKLSLFCVGWFFITWLPVSNIIPISTKMADRYIYLSAAGFFLWFAAALIRVSAIAFFEPTKLVKRIQPIAGCLFVVFLIISLSFLSIKRNRVWANSRSLWEDSVSKDPRNSIAHNNLGIALAEQGNFDDAIRHYKEVLHIKPDHKEARLNLGNALLKQGKFRESIICYKESLRLGYNPLRAHFNLGTAFLKKGDLEAAIRHFKEALRISPNYADALNNLGNALFKQGDLKGAIRHYKETVNLKPDSAIAHFNLGNALLKQGDFEAARHYKEVIRIEPGHAIAHYNLGFILLRQGKIDEAISHYEEVLRLRPDHGGAHYQLGIALTAQGKVDKAINHYFKALKLNPSLETADFHYNLGVALTKHGKLEEASAHFSRALEIDPEYSKARNFFQRVIKEAGKGSKELRNLGIEELRD